MPSILSLTHKQIEADREAAFPKDEALLVKRYRRYTRGRQNSTLTSQQIELLKSVTGNQHCDNICKLIVSETANRLELLRFSVANDAVETFLNDFYVKTGMADFSKDVQFSTVRDGNFAVVLGWDGDGKRVILNKEKWWDGDEGIFVAYGSNNLPAYAVKDWITDDKKERRVIWYPNRIERYIRQGRGWLPYSLPEDNGVWPVPWVRPDGSPLGLPVVHFGNGSDDDKPYGASTLDGGALGLQDEINDTQRNITIAGRLTAAQMIYATGVDLKDPTTGQDITLRVGPGAVFTSPNDAAKFGAIQAGDLSQLEKEYNIKLNAIARMTATPVHLITNVWPSGEALIQANQPLISKVKNLAKSIGPAWASVAHKATVLANVFSKAGLDEGAMIDAIFADPETNDPVTQTAVANGRKDMVSRQEYFRLLGYSPEKIKQLIQELKEEASLLPAPSITISGSQGQGGQPATVGGVTAPNLAGAGGAVQSSNPNGGN